MADSGPATRAEIVPAGSEPPRTLIGVSGLLALQRLHRLLRDLAGSAGRATSFFALWLAVQSFAGTQLSWILRPYLGKPQLPVQFWRDGALQGSFLEEVGHWLGL